MADDRQHDRPCAPACRRRTPVKRGADAQGLGRSRGGLSTKIHAAGDALGLPVRLIAGPGQHSDIASAHDLIDGFATTAVLGDKGYDADHLCQAIEKPAPSSSYPQAKPKSPAPLRLRPLQRAQSDRTLLQQTQAVPPRRHPLRQVPRQLHGLRQTCRHRCLAQIVKSSLRPNIKCVMAGTCINERLCQQIG